MLKSPEHSSVFVLACSRKARPFGFTFGDYNSPFPKARFRASPTRAVPLTVFSLNRYSLHWRNLSELAITETELRLIAAAAIMGLSVMPVQG